MISSCFISAKRVECYITHFKLQNWFLRILLWQQSSYHWRHSFFERLELWEWLTLRLLLVSWWRGSEFVTEAMDERSPQKKIKVKDKRILNHLIYCEEFKFRGWYDAAFRLGQETHQILFEFQQTRWASRSKSRSRSQDVSSLAFYRRRIPNRKVHELYAIKNCQSWLRERDFERDAQRVCWNSKRIWWVSWPRRNAASYQPRNLNSSQVLDNFLLPYLLK